MSIFSNSSTTFLPVRLSITNMVSVPMIPSGSFIQAPNGSSRALWITGLPTDLILVQLSVMNQLNRVLYNYRVLYNNQINARALIGQLAIVYCSGKLMEKSRVFWIITWDVGRTLEEFVKKLACGSWFTNSSRVLPTSRVVYQPINHRNLWGNYHLHGKTGNSSWKIKWFAPFRLGSFRKYGLWYEVMLFFCALKSL